MNPYWSWGLSAVGLTVQYLAAKSPKWAWSVGTVSQIPWLVYAVVSDQWGFFVSSTLYGAVYIRHWVKLHKPKPKDAQPELCQQS